MGKPEKSERENPSLTENQSKNEETTEHPGEQKDQITNNRPAREERHKMQRFGQSRQTERQ